MGPILITEPRLLPILNELKQREPIFHHPELGTDREDFLNMTTEDFWEVGASGKRYSRSFVVETLVQRQNDPSYEDVWETKDFHCREIAKDTYLLTYILLQDKIRLTRRSTIWKRVEGEWRIFYHQGTVVQDS